MAFYKCDKKQNGGTGFKVDDVSNFTAVADSSDAKVTLSWTDPDDFEIEGTVQAKWAGTIIVRKAYSEPKSTGDGTIVLNSTVKNQYSVNGFEDENVYLGTTYYYRAFPYTTDGVTTVGTSVYVETAAAPIYGVEWDGTASSAWTRTDMAAEFTNPYPYYAAMQDTPSSPFDNISPWKDMQIVEDAEAGTLVSIPKFYYKLSQNNGVGLKVQISNEPIEGFHVSPAHMDRGDGKGERDVIYVGRYHCSSVDYKSRSGDLPKANVTRATARTNIHNLGNTIWQYDVATWFTIWLLYIVEYANWDSQTVIGRGDGERNPREATTTGYTDLLPYHTGISKDTRTTAGCGTQYRYIEGLWDNVMFFLDGGYTTVETTDKISIHLILNPSNFSDTTNGITIESDMNYIYGLPTVFHINDTPGAFPILVVSEYATGSGAAFYKTYSCDEWILNEPSVFASGSSYAATSQYEEGIFNIITVSGRDDTYAQLGCRLIKLP